MKGKKYACGAKPSPYDKRDYKINDLVAKSIKLPTSYRVLTDAPVLNQGQSSTCVACSLSLSRSIQEHTQSKKHHQFSPTYIYGNRKASDYQGEGMHPRQALKCLQEYGVCQLEDLPGFYSFEESKKKYQDKKTELDKKAYPYRISSYYGLNGEREIKTALVEVGVVSAMFPTYDCLYNVGKDGNVYYDKKGKNENHGYHEMTIIGYNTQGWIVQNSWGTLWGNKGKCFIPYDYPIREAWAMIDKITEEELQAKAPIDLKFKIILKKIVKFFRNLF